MLLSSGIKIIRWLIVTLSVAAIVVALAWYILPNRVSTDIVVDNFKFKLAQSLGHEIEFEGRPQFELWPTPKITLDNVRIGANNNERGGVSGATDETYLLNSEHVSANLGLLSTILGEPTFSGVTLIRPIVHFELYPDGTSNWLPALRLEGGAVNNVASGVAGSVAGNTASGSGGNNDSAQSQAFKGFDQIEIMGGTFILTSDPGSAPERITSINGSLSWPSFNLPFSANLDAIVRGETISINVADLDIDQLLAGNDSATQIALQSDLINLTYKGSLQSGTSLFMDGTLQLETPSVRRALEWSGSDITAGAALGQVELSADISGSLDSLKLADIIVLIGQNRGVGIIDYSLKAGSPPLLSGTLAFNSLDIQSFFRAFTPLPRSGDDIAQTIDTRFLKELGLDLGLSAQSANFGPIAMSNLAATVQINKEAATFNIGNASAYQGQLLGKVSISEKGIDGGGEISFSARNMQLDQLFSSLDVTGPIPQGEGNMDIKLFSERPLWATDVENISGKFSLKMADGTVPNIDLGKIKALSTDRGFRSLSDMGGADISFQSAELTAEVSSGIARLSDTQIITDNEYMSFRGVVPFAKGSLALFATIDHPRQNDASEPNLTNSVSAANPANPANATSATNPARNGLSPTARASYDLPISFFIGGSWPNPILSPLISESIER